MILDSHIEKRIAVHSTLGIPRWHKRILFYIFKIRYLQLNYKKINKLPNFKIRSLLTSSYFNEYEYYNKKN